MLMFMFMFVLILIMIVLMLVLVLVFNDEVHVQIVHVDVGVDLEGDEFNVGDSDYVDDGFDHYYDYIMFERVECDYDYFVGGSIICKR